MSRAARLAELRALRQAGKTAFSTYQVKEAEDIYDEVDEDGYKKKVRERLDRDDFVIDDNGAGYADDGREELDGRHYDSMTESEEEIPLKGKAGTLPHWIGLVFRPNHGPSQEEARRRKGKDGKGKQQHQQILQ